MLIKKKKKGKETEAKEKRKIKAVQKNRKLIGKCKLFSFFLVSFPRSNHC